MGDGDFVEAVLKAADEQLERSYQLKAKGFTLENVAERVAQVMDIPVELVWEKSRRAQIVEARSFLLLGIKRAGDEHDGYRKVVKAYTAGCKLCREKRGKNCSG